MCPSIQLILLAAILIGVDITISDAEFLQTMTLPSASGATVISSSSPVMSQFPTPANLSRSDTNVTVQIGSHAYLPCNSHYYSEPFELSYKKFSRIETYKDIYYGWTRTVFCDYMKKVRRLFGKPVSWVRVRDGHILTVDQTTFIADQRFQSIYAGEQERWSLQIKYVQEHDMGLYECQVSTEPKMSARVFLKVVVPKTELIGDHNRFVKAGSKVALHCIVRGSIEPPSYIIWFRGNQQIVQGNKQGWYMQIDREIFGNSSDQQNTIGSLIIPSVNKRDSGNYTCSPSNSAPVTVDLHVLNGEYSASAIMSSADSCKLNYFILLILLMASINSS